MKNWLWLLLATLTLPGWTQKAFNEGIVRFQADTVRRVDAHPAVFIVTERTIFKKGDLARIEITRVNRITGGQKHRQIEIRNRKGILLCSESPWQESNDPSRPTRSATMLLSYDEEKARLPFIQNKIHTVSRTGARTKRLGLWAEKIILQGPAGEEPTEALVTASIDIPLSLSFDALRTVGNTPLEFSIREYGWLTRYRAVGIERRKLPDAFFEVNASQKIMTMEQMLKELQDFK